MWTEKSVYPPFQLKVRKNLFDDPDGMYLIYDYGIGAHSPRCPNILFLRLPHGTTEDQAGKIAESITASVEHAGVGYARDAERDLQHAVVSGSWSIFASGKGERGDA